MRPRGGFLECAVSFPQTTGLVRPSLPESFAVQKSKAGSGSERAPAVRVIKKYPNRRLYDTDTSSYITLAEVKSLVMDNEPFVVRDA